LELLWQIRERQGRISTEKQEALCKGNADFITFMQLLGANNPLAIEISAVLTA